jgi:uncharacterized protein (DUF486 family)
MNSKIKKIIAREGLVIVGITLFGLLIIGINFLCNTIYVKSYVNTPEENRVGWQVISYANYDTINRIGTLIILFGYPFYWLICFIGWALGALKEK